MRQNMSSLFSYLSGKVTVKADTLRTARQKRPPPDERDAMQRTARQGGQRTKRAPFEQTGAAMQFDALQDCNDDCCCGLVFAEVSDADKNVW